MNSKTLSSVALLSAGVLAALIKPGLRAALWAGFSENKKKGLEQAFSMALLGVLLTSILAIPASAACLNRQGLSESLFVSNSYLSLPRMIPARQHFVIHYNYPMDRVSGAAMEGGGVGGLIDDGYFATLVLSAGSNNRFDGSELKRYRSRAQICPGLLIYDRVNGPVSKGIKPKT